MIVPLGAPGAPGGRGVATGAGVLVTAAVEVTDLVGAIVAVRVTTAVGAAVPKATDVTPTGTEVAPPSGGTVGTPTPDCAPVPPIVVSVGWTEDGGVPLVTGSGVVISLGVATAVGEPVGRA